MNQAPRSSAAGAAGLRASRSSRCDLSVTSDRAVVPAVSDDLHGDVGVDVKCGVTQNLTADFT